MKSSNLKHLISIERTTVKKNADGIPVDVWEEILRSRAKIVNVEGRESTSDEDTPIKIEVYIRFNPNITLEETDRVRFKDKCFNITFLDNLENKNKWLMIKGVCIK